MGSCVGKRHKEQDYIEDGSPVKHKGSLPSKEEAKNVTD